VLARIAAGGWDELKTIFTHFFANKKELLATFAAPARTVPATPAVAHIGCHVWTL
jgi:hypothetical protein